MSGTPRLSLPFLSVGQSQKEFSHNEALQTLDILVAGAVEDLPSATPPIAPAPGDCFIVGASSTGAWTGMAGFVAGWTSGGWRFIAPREGMTLNVRSTGTGASFRAGAWEYGAVRGSSLVLGDQKVVGSRLPAIASPAGGSMIDGQARTAIASILSALRTHGLIES